MSIKITNPTTINIVNPSETIQEEGEDVVSAPLNINFVGAGVTATVDGGDAIVTIPATAVGAASSTDNAIARFDSTTGKVIQNSIVTVSDTAVIRSVGVGQSLTIQPAAGDGSSVAGGDLNLSAGDSSAWVNISNGKALGSFYVGSNVIATGAGLFTTGLSASNGGLELRTAGPDTGIAVAEGTNGRQGVVTLVDGTATVTTTGVTANSRIFLTAQTTGAAPGALYISARTASTSFTITSTSGTDTSVVAYEVFEPAPA